VTSASVSACHVTVTLMSLTERPSNRSCNQPPHNDNLWPDPAKLDDPGYNSDLRTSCRVHVTTTF